MPVHRINVIKRDGRKENVSFDKITKRIDFLLYGELRDVIDPIVITQKVVNNITDCITTTKIDEMCSTICASMSIYDYHYSILAGRISINSHQKNTSADVEKVYSLLYDNKDILGEHNPIVSKEFYGIIEKNVDILNKMLDYSRDYNIDYFGFKSLEKSYLFRTSEKILERPQHMWLRVAIQLYGDDMHKVEKCYNYLSKGLFTHATPTLYHSGTERPQMSSCFVGDTLVYTDKGKVPIRDVSIGMIVKTHKGGYKRVVQIHRNNLNDRAVYKLNIPGTDTIKATEDHEFWVFNIKTSKTGWKMTKDLTDGDFLLHAQVHDVMYQNGIVVKENSVEYLEHITDIGHGEEIKDYYIPFKGKEQIFIKEDIVYTLGVEEDHSYSIAGVIAKNCFLMGTEDSIEGIFDTFKECAQISKWAGGIGIHISNIRSNGAYIRKTNGHGSGVMPMLRVYNEVAEYVNQSGKRKGSIALYIEPHHADIFDFLAAKRNFGPEKLRARDLFYGIWMPDLFMKLLEKNKEWYLMNPDISKRLNEVYGKEYEELYFRYVSEGKYEKKVMAIDVWNEILTTQIETGMPYMCYKDAVNYKTNQKNLGTIKSSNLCTEIMEYSDFEQTANCNIASIALSKFLTPPDISFFSGKECVIYTLENCEWCLLAKGLLKEYNIHHTVINLERSDIPTFKEKRNIIQENITFPYIITVDSDKVEEFIGGYTELRKMTTPKVDYSLLEDVAETLVENLDNVIEKNYYPNEKTRKSNMAHRPIGIGVQGLADMFAMMKLTFDGEEAKKINKNIFETIYYGALKRSLELAKSRGKYSSFDGSPASKGLLQFDLWDMYPTDVEHSGSTVLSGLWDFKTLKEEIKEHGLRNSLLLAPMPTATTSQILGNNEAFEPFSSNLYVRKTIAGEFSVVNKHLVNDLKNISLYTRDIIEKIIINRGSIQNIEEIPSYIKKMYRTVWEISQKGIIDMSADRGRFIDQSQSLNIKIPDVKFSKLTSMHFYGWKKGLKTGSYYIHTQTAANAQQFTVEPKTADCENCSG